MLLLCFSLRAAGQGRKEGPYFLSFKRDVLNGGVAVGSVIWSKHLENQVPDILLSDLDLGTVPFFNRLPDTFRSKPARLWSDQARDFSKALPFLLQFGKSSRRDAGKLAILFAESYYLTKGLTDAMKVVVRRPRPYVRDGLGVTDVVV